MIDFSVRFHVSICSFIRWLQTQSLFLSLLHLHSKSPNRKGTVATWGWPLISVPNPRVWPSQLKWGKGSKDRIELKDQDNFYLENIKEKPTHQLFFHENTRLNGLLAEAAIWTNSLKRTKWRTDFASSVSLNFGISMGAHVHRWLASWISSPFKGDLRQMLPLQRLGICKCRWPGVAVECHSLWDRNHWDMLDGQNPPIRMLQTCNSWTSIDASMQDVVHQ